MIPLALLCVALCSLVLAAEARQDSPTYYILYSEGGGLYILAPSTENPIWIADDVAVPPELLYDSAASWQRNELQNHQAPLTEGKTLISALPAPDNRHLLLSEGDCAEEHCRPPFDLWLADSFTGERETIPIDLPGLEGMAPIPIAWNPTGDAAVIDTFDVDTHSPFAGLWRYRPATGTLEPVDLGPGGYNGRLWPSPDNRYLLMPGFAGDTAGIALGMPAGAPAHLKPTARIKLLDLTTGEARTLVVAPEGAEFNIRGWLPAANLPALRDLTASPQRPAPSPQAPPATSGFQRPMVNHHYGWRWLEWTGSVYHPGVDYNGPGSGNADCGAPVYAAANGTVRYVNTGSWGGLVIEHVWQGTTIYSQYGHIFNSFVSVGQDVVKGQQVADIGNVGTVYCHLHWEMREADHPNPAYGPDWNTTILTSPSLVNAYYEDPEWWVDNHGPYTACNPGSNEIALFVDTNYTGQCVTLDIGEYADAAAIGLPNDTVSSIRIGGTPQGELCEHNDFAGVCEAFSESDPDLTDNAIGNDTVSSARVAVTGPLVFAGLTIDDDAAGSSNGNGDGQLNPGETIELSVSLHNQGDINATGIEATIGSADPYVSDFPDNTVSGYADIPGGGVGDPADPWEFTVDPTAPGGHVITFCLDPITATNGGPWWSCFDVTIVEPVAPGCDLYEPNDSPGAATPTALGQTLASGAICPAGDVDYFAFDGSAGDRIALDIDAQSQGSDLDATLQLLGTDGTTILAQNDDEMPGELLDPRLGFQLAAGGRYTVRVASEIAAVGGSDYHYILRLIHDETVPTTAILAPDDGGWLDPSWTTVTVSAADGESGVEHVDFWWQEAGSGWTFLGSDVDGRDGWSLGFDTSALPEHQGSALRVEATDWAGNQAEDTALNLGTDRTVPNSQATVEPLIYSPIASVPWTAGDSLSGVAEVRLWVRYQGGPWAESGLPAQPGDSGIFRYIFAFGSGSYDFATSAVDNAGNSEGPPAAADATTTYDPSNNISLPLLRR